jgi:peptidoglycan/LPS O-acetylase OafA/YrhL
MEQTPQSNQQSNPFSNLHKQRLYSLVIAGLALITLFLPWVTFGFLGSLNGFRSWGIFSLLGILGIAATVFMGNKAMSFDDTMKKIAIGSFGAIALGALIFLLTKNSNYGPFAGAGIGIWICLIAGLAGLVFLFGLVKIPEKK